MTAATAATTIISDDNSDGTAGPPAIITRAEARAQGLERYFTAKACKRGHVVERYAGDAGCVMCVKGRVSAYRRTPTGKAAHAAYSASPAGKLRRAVYLATPLGKATTARRDAAYEASAKGAATRRAKKATRRARKVNATVPLTPTEKAHRLAIIKARPTGWQTDHIRPLSRGGLEHPLNLRNIPAVINLQKHNHWDETDPLDILHLLRSLALFMDPRFLMVLLDEARNSEHAPPWLQGFRDGAMR